jgi:hypothetical protein
MNGERDLEDLKAKQAFQQEKLEIMNLINKSKKTLDPQVPSSELVPSNLEEEKQPKPPAAKRRKLNTNQEMMIPSTQVVIPSANK